MADMITLGWRERLALPQFGILALKAKLDTGARSSSLHVDELETFTRDGDTWLRFAVGLGRRSAHKVQCEAPACDRRVVVDTGGGRSERWFIRTEVMLAGERFEVDMNLTDRRHMLFPMLLGRTALVGRFAVNPALSYTLPKPAHTMVDKP
ncbi:ATP-dependent zinc protease [Dyella flava]|uniref:ATP-dependent zinc protease n=1 Tax=Dyella flava TaxID=1920170 RepID=A0ABS2K881_9GAMM|nr:RimK/LysX family protein [Dyella flava]MBM7126972.1 ATP-dependent zinc protease [Dyella flava]GLQ50267.1 ribosomal protein S6 modification protein [Dyella flava]